MNCRSCREFTCCCAEFADCPMTRYCGEGCTQTDVLENISEALDSIAGNLCLALSGGGCRCCR